MQLQRIDGLQKDALAQMGFNDPRNETKPLTPGAIFGLLHINPDIAEIALGKSGRQLIELINKIDLDHPDAAPLFDFIINQNNIQQVLETVAVADRCKDLNSISRNFHKLVNRKLSMCQMASVIRLLKSKKERDSLRSQRSWQAVNLGAMYKNSELWKMLPTDFSIFNRHNTPYIEYLDLAERKMSRYSELGCEEISNKITEKIKQLRISLRDRYYGFNRVTITVASAILSKMHGYKFRTSYDREDNVTFNVVVSNYFSQHSKEYSYEPKLYSFYELGCQAPKATLRAINHLDSFPDINGKPLFDNYLVLVPSIKYDGSYDSLRNLDMNLIKNRDIVPVLLGERNSKCYFLCYFT